MGEIRLKIEAKIAELLQKMPKGNILFVDNFLNLGNPENIKKALYRLTNEKKILIRLAHGIYLYPKIDEELGILYPSTEEIAEAIAKRDKARIIPTGIYALNRLGLSTQVPMKIVYLTDGSARNIKIGKRTISFKRTTPKNLMTKGEISTLVIQALKEIGKENVTDEILKQLKTVLKKEMQENIFHDAKLAPAWINNILKQT
ncbi:MAG: DUF6088 family protein [Bacteroidales bacterium]|nr:DUF6088 family protein [Bacteroidales bacterium]